MKKQEVRAIIEKVGIVPVIRASSAEEARFAADCVCKGGVPIVEITMTVPGALDVIRELVKTMPDVLVGAGTVLSEEALRKCAAAGAQFLVTPGFNAPTVAAARELDLLIMVGALTPSEIMAASASGADFVKVFPCGSIGGPKYLQTARAVSSDTAGSDWRRDSGDRGGLHSRWRCSAWRRRRNDRERCSKGSRPRCTEQISYDFCGLGAGRAQDIRETLRPIAGRQPR